MKTFMLGDYGAALRLRVTDDGEAVDLSLATVKRIKLRKPDGVVVTKDAEFTNDGTDGNMQYTLVAGDLDVAGRWRWQGYLAGVSGFTGHTSEGKPFEVKQLVG